MHKLLWSYCCAVLAVGSIIVAQNMWSLNKSDWASWVQAVGSIAAIIGAYVIGERQSKATLESAREAHHVAEESKRVSRFAVLRAAHNRASLIRAALTKGEPPLNLIEVYHSSIIDSLVLAMSSIPVSELGSDEAVDAFILFSGQFVFLRKALEEYVDGPSADPIVQRQLDRLKAQGYGREHQDEILTVARNVRRRNVEVHLKQIEFEFEKLKNHLGPR
jgi:hypothetical protein